LKILILNHYASIPEVSGAETRHYELARRFVEKGHDVHIIVGNYHHLLKDMWTNAYGEKFQKNGVHFHVVKTSYYHGNSVRRLLGMIDYYKNAQKSIKNLIMEYGRFDVIISSSPHPFTLLAGKNISEKFSIPLYIELRDIWPDDLIEAGVLSEKSLLSMLFTYILKKSYPYAVKIISLVPDINSHLNRLKIKKEYIEIPNGISLKDFYNPPENCKDKVSYIINTIKINSKIKIGYFGSFSPTNAIDEFFEKAMSMDEKSLKDFQFYLFGNGERKQKLKEISKEEKINLVVFDPIPKKCVYLVMKEMDALLFTLKDFGNVKYPAYSSNKIVEYMATGKPILSVYHENFPHYRTGGGVFFDINNISSIKKSLSDIKSKIGTVMSENIEYVKKYRDWDVLAEKLFYAISS